MKSKRLDNLLQTSCKECKFAVYEGDTQTGCEAGRIETLEEDLVFEAYDDEKEFYVINTFCTYYRDTASKRTLEEVQKDSKKTFGIGLYIDEANLDKISKTVCSIINCNYDKDKIKVSINHKLSMADPTFRAKLTNVLESLKVAGIKTTITVYSDFHSNSLIDYDTFKALTPSSFAARVYAGQEIPPDMFNKIEDAVNDKLVRAVFFQQGDISMIMLKVVSLRYTQHNDYDIMEKSLKEESKLHNLFVEIV